MKSLEIKIPKLSLEISGFDTTREELTKLIPELRVQCEVSAEDEEKKVDLKENVKKCKNDMESCAKLASASLLPHRRFDSQVQILFQGNRFQIASNLRKHRNTD